MELCAGERVSSKLLKSAELAFSRGRLVQLGALRRPTDPGFSYGSESFSVSVSLRAKLTANINLSNPTTWDDFSLLFQRLIHGYVTHFPSEYSRFLAYFERLAQNVNLGMASVGAVIEYDRRVRTAHRDSWGWLDFDAQTFEMAKFLHPKTAPAWSPPSSKPRGKNFNPQAKVNQVCRDWIKGGASGCSKVRAFCKFAHQCLNPKCVANGSVDHTPNSGSCV